MVTRDVVPVVNKTEKAADEAVGKINKAVDDSRDVVKSVNVGPAASGLVREASGLVREASGLVREASGLVRNDKTEKTFKGLAEKGQDFSRKSLEITKRFRDFLDSTKTRDASGLVRDASGLVRDASGLVRDASGLVRDASGLVR
ncbi:MAG: hypothetical protein HXS44_03445 [Theionarchaea archaeon]|nr:hypothetical protein [Theionarchaea archaeon]